MQRGDVFRDRKFYFFIGLVLILIVVNYRQWTSASRLSTSKQNEKTALSKENSEDPVLIADALNRKPEELGNEKRNIFNFFNPGPPPPTPEEIEAQRRAAEAAKPDPVCGNGACEQGEDLSSCPADCTPPPPPVPQINLRYIGFVSEPKGPVAILTDGKEVYIGRVNDIIVNQYRVLKISEDSVELGFLNNNQSSTIRFQGNQGG